MELGQVRTLVDPDLYGTNAQLRDKNGQTQPNVLTQIYMEMFYLLKTQKFDLLPLFKDRLTNLTENILELVKDP